MIRNATPKVRYVLRTSSIRRQLRTDRTDVVQLQLIRRRVPEEQSLRSIKPRAMREARKREKHREGEKKPAPVADYVGDKKLITSSVLADKVIIKPS